MLVRVLGSAAGGGFPQWNCGCENCRGVRAGTIRARARTQDSIAVSADGVAWFVLNTGPDILAQIAAQAPLHPRAPRHTPICGVVLSNGDLDHVLGLFCLRESQPYSLYASEAVRRGLEDRNAIFQTLRRFPGQLVFHALQEGVDVPLSGPDGLPSGLRITPFALPGKRPLHLERSSAPSREDNFGLRIRDERTGGTLLYAPGAASAGALSERAEPVDCLLFDGTFFREDELIEQGLGERRAAEMAHVPIDGPGGSLCALAAYPAPQALHAHQQHEPHPSRRLPSTPQGGGRRLGGRVRWPGDHPMNALERPLSRDEFLARLRAEGERRYHDRHPFHIRMHEGTLTRAQLQAWVENRYYYQTRIPIKDALILSKADDPTFRRAWLRRIVDHDGAQAGEGGLELWLRLAEGVGLAREDVRAHRRVLPAVRFACDAYVQLVRERSLVEAVASSLTEFFSPQIMTRRLAAWAEHYPWVDPEVLTYFRTRVDRARRDSEEALAFVLAEAQTRVLQERCLEAFVTKCEILWSLLDAVEHAYPRSTS